MGYKQDLIKGASRQMDSRVQPFSVMSACKWFEEQSYDRNVQTQHGLSVGKVDFPPLNHLDFQS